MQEIRDLVAHRVRAWMDGASAPLILGLCGSQGSGKSTLAAALRHGLEAQGRRVAILSLDDLYLNGAERARLARDIHPLFRTRGVPGTHDVARGIAILDALHAGEPTDLPRFDKARDEPAPGQEAVAPPIDLLVFEGWCMGARPQGERALEQPVNMLERNEDPDGTWRRHVNAQLQGPYADLFSRLDRLVLLAAPDFAVVRRWRGQQEDDLRAQGHGDKVMNPAELDRFVQHYERLTRHILAEMPPRADLTLPLDEERRLKPGSSLPAGG